MRGWVTSCLSSGSVFLSDVGQMVDLSDTSFLLYLGPKSTLPRPSGVEESSEYLCRPCLLPASSPPLALEGALYGGLGGFVAAPCQAPAAADLLPPPPPSPRAVCGMWEARVIAGV